MKKITLFLILSVVIVLSAGAHKYKKHNKHITISIQTFYNDLSPYGDWIYTPDYGYAWRPYFDRPEAFRPYSSNGNWVYTEYGWTWASNYQWGWATFHYGRWDYDNYLGWMWIPGYEWAPAWVTWGSYNNYWGWAPMGPDIYAGSHSNWYAPDPWWTFVPYNHFCSNNWNHYIYNRPVHVTNITHITNVYVNNNSNNNSWYHGPRVSDVERYGKNKVRRMQVVDSERRDNTGVRNDRLNVYRPSVENKRNEARPSEYRNVEQARKESRIQPTNARTNDPGSNRIRENRTESRSTPQLQSPRGTTQAKETRVEPRPAVRVDNTRETRVEPRATNQVPYSRINEVSREVKASPRTTAQPAPRNTSATRENNTESRSGSQVTTQRSTTPSQTATQRATNQAVRIAPAGDKGNYSSSPQSERRETPAAQPASSTRQRTATPATNSRNVQTERKQEVKQEAKPADDKNRSEAPARGSSGNTKRR